MERGSCTWESSKFCCPDWGSLEPEILRLIFSIKQPLQLDLRLVCHAWASAFMPLLTRLTAHSSGVWKHSQLGSSSPADVLRLTKFCNLRQLDLQCLGPPWFLPPLPQLRELNLGHAQFRPDVLDHISILPSLHTLQLAIKDTTQLDLTTLQELHSLRCLAVTLCPEWGSVDNFLEDVGERGGLPQLTGFTVLVEWPYTTISRTPNILWRSSGSAQYGWMQNLRSLELAAVRPLHSKHPHQRLPIDVLFLTELQRLCEQAPQLRRLTLTTRYCDVHLADYLASLTGLTALNLTMADGWGMPTVELFQRLPLDVMDDCCHDCQRLPLDVVTSLHFWKRYGTVYSDLYPFHLCANLVSLTFNRAMKGALILDLLQLTQLRSLELQHGVKDSCTPADISNLVRPSGQAGEPAAAYLVILPNAIDFIALYRQGRLTGLTKLQLGPHCCAHQLDCVHAVGKLSRLRQLGLNIYWHAYQAMALRDRDCLGSLRGLDASIGVCISTSMGAISLEPLLGLANLTRLEVLHSRRKHWSVSTLHELATLTSLRKLVIHRLADADVPMLASLTQLTHLRMVGKSKISEWFRRNKLRTETLSKLPQLLYFSTALPDYSAT